MRCSFRISRALQLRRVQKCLIHRQAKDRRTQALQAASTAKSHQLLRRAETASCFRDLSVRNGASHRDSSSRDFDQREDVLLQALVAQAVPTGFLIFSGFIGLGTLAGQVVHASVCIVLSTTLFCEAGLGRTFYPVMRVRSCYVPEPGRHCPSQQELDFAATFCGLPFCNAEEVFWSSDV